MKGRKRIIIKKRDKENGNSIYFPVKSKYDGSIKVMKMNIIQNRSKYFYDFFYRVRKMKKKKFMKKVGI